MRVKIGKYTPWWSTHYTEIRYLQGKYGDKFSLDEKDYTRLDKMVVGFLDAWQDVLNCTVNPIFNRMGRKIKVRIDSYDVWNMDSTLAYVVVPMLKQLKDTKHGAPNVEPEDVPEELRPTPEEIKAANLNGAMDEKWFDRWDYVIDEMIFAFEHIADNDWEESFRSGDVDITWEPQNVNGKVVDEDDADFFEMKKGPKDTFKVDTDGIQAVYDRIDNGTRLFGKYYRGLWT